MLLKERKPRKDAAQEVPCVNCGKVMKVYPSYLRTHTKQRQYCSKACEMTQKVRPVEELFWSHVDKSGGPDACWIWTAGKNHGRGQFHPNGQKRPVLAHRFAWQLAHPGEEIPPDKWILHNCPGGGNGLCVRHLYLGTPSQNAQDTHRDGRRTPETTAKLNWDIVRAIRTDLAEGKGRAYCSETYVISKAQIRNIALGLQWKEDVERVVC